VALRRALMGSYCLCMEGPMIGFALVGRGRVHRALEMVRKVEAVVARVGGGFNDSTKSSSDEQ
jgi:hypothetical protein